MSFAQLLMTPMSSASPRLAQVPAAAPRAAAPSARIPEPVFLATDAVSVAHSLPPPPAEGSARARADFDRILELQGSRTKAEEQRAAFVVDVKLATLFGPAYGALTAAEVDAWSAFFEKVRIDTDYFVQHTKLHWGRPRPYMADERVQPCVHREVTPAYPSGHAAISRVFAAVLAELDPTRAAAFSARAEQIGSDRVLAGVHHPSDIEAGNALGDQVWAALTTNPTFRRELAELSARRAVNNRAPAPAGDTFERVTPRRWPS